MKVLFIGGTGVISSECSELCIDKGIDLYLLNRGKSIRKAPDEAKLIYCDIRNDDYSFLSKNNFDVVVSWIAYTKEHVVKDYEFFRNKIKQYIFISSASAYHKPILKLPIDETTPLHNPYWEYSRNKIDCENFLIEKFKEDNFPITIVRPSHTYDRTKNPLKENYLPFYRMKNKKEIIIHDDGNTLWTLTHSKDFAVGFCGLLGNNNAIGEAYNITSDETLTWNEIAKILSDKADLELKTAHIPSTFIKKYDDEWGDGLLGDKAHSVKFDNKKIKSLVPEFNCKIKFENGAEEIVEWFSKSENQIVNHQLDELMDKIINDYKK
ncbi:MAG: SDR family oxidoreductase [Melioribacteraceae bacterium]|nr:SDR family oxidoreductase [Melioribacteraceae bacterium]